MDYWRNAFEGRRLLFYDHTELQGVDDDDYTSNITNPSKSVHEWDDMKPLDFDRNVTNPNDLDLPESVFPDILTNSVSSEPSLGCLATEISIDSCKPAVSSIPVQSEFGSKSSEGKLPCPTELKFEGLAYSGELKIRKSSKDSPNSKKPRYDNNPRTPIFACQVHGCDRDLSLFKDYYRRHKVCDIHSKSPLVLINGIEKRFCQQCSRFHLLDEFDDGKRSCRKRLAGHNARRRKPAVVGDYAKSNQFLQFCQGSQNFGGEESMSMYSNASRALSLLSAEEWQSLSSRSSACIPTSVPVGMPPPDQNPDHYWIYNQSSSSSSATVAAAGSSSTGSYFDRLGDPIVPESYNGGVGNIDLNQLSAHLQRVEEQRNYVVMKPENYIFR